MFPTHASADADEESLARARSTLDADSRDGAPGAIKLLLKDGSSESIDAIAEFGARTRYPKHIILAGKAVAEADPKQAARRIEKQLRTFKEVPPYLARLCVMAEQIPGTPGSLILEKRSKDRRELVAAAAVRALGARREEDARKRLESLVTSPRPQVVSQIPGYNKGLEGDYAFYPSTWDYGSLAMYQMGGRYWSRWRDECIKDLLPNQNLSGCELGSWPMPKKQFFGGLIGGTVYSTCMAILTMETFYRYQPYLARAPLRSQTKEEAAKRHKEKEAADAKRGPEKPKEQK